MERTKRRWWRGVAGAAGLILIGAGCEQGGVPSPNGLVPSPPQPTISLHDLQDDPALQEVAYNQAAANPTEILTAIYSPDPRVSARGLFAMGSMREAFASQAVRDGLSHPDSTVRAGAAWALGQMPRAESTGWLTLALDAEIVPTTRAGIVTALGKAGDATAAQILVERAPDVRESVLVLALARLSLAWDPAPAALDRLARALGSRDGEARELASWYFGRAGDPSDWARYATHVRASLDAYPLNDPAAAGLLRGLGRSADPGDLDAILRFQTSPDWRLRVRTAAALSGLVASDRTRAALFSLLDDESQHVAVAAANTLGAIRRILPEDLDRMEAWIDAHPDEWQTATPLLGGLAAQGRAGFAGDWYRQRVEAPLRVRAAAIGSLARTPDQGVIRTLMDVARSDTVMLATAALRGLVDRWPTDRDNRELHGGYWDTFRDAFQGGDRAIVSTLAATLVDSVFLARGSLPLISEVYDLLVPVQDLEAQQAVVRAVTAVNDDLAVDVLRRALNDPHRAVRFEAAAALRRLLRQQVEPDRAFNPPARLPDWEVLGQLGPRPVLVIETEKGRVRIRMDAQRAPVTVQTVVEFARAGLYDGVEFHRVIPDFVAQGGDFERGDGYGGPGFSLRTEITGLPFLRGVVGLAAAGPDSEGSQFFITHTRLPHLDDVYVAFGWVEQGMDVADRIYQGDRIVRATVEPDPDAGANRAG